MEPNENRTRNHKVVTLLNNQEREFMEKYLRKYKISNKSRWIRETLMTFIYQNLGNDYPTLFDEQEMRR